MQNNSSKSIIWVVFTLCLILLLVSCGNDSNNIKPTDTTTNAQNSDTQLDISRDKLSDQSFFHVQLEPVDGKIPLNEIHSWRLIVLDAKTEQPIDNANIILAGGMPEHNHGFPTEPTISVSDQPGVYLIEGMKFQMGGWWQMRFEISADGRDDRVKFNVLLP